MCCRVSFPVWWEFRSVPVAPPAGCSLRKPVPEAGLQHFGCALVGFVMREVLVGGARGGALGAVGAGLFRQVLVNKTERSKREMRHSCAGLMVVQLCHTAASHEARPHSKNLTEQFSFLHFGPDSPKLPDFKKKNFVCKF